MPEKSQHTLAVGLEPQEVCAAGTLPFQAFSPWILHSTRPRDKYLEIV